MATDAHLPIDTSVTVPPSVAAAARAADALLAAATAPPVGGPPPPVGTPPVVEIPTGGPPPPAGYAQPTPQQVPPQVSQQVTHPQDPDQLPPPAQPGTLEAQWEQRFRSLRGRVDAMTSDWRRKEAGYTAQVDDLMRQVQSRPQPPPQGQGPAQLPAETITPEEREKWGDDMSDFVLSVANRIAGAQTSQVQQRVEGELQQTRQDIWARDNAAMQASLDQMLPGGNGQPDWRVVNEHDPSFVTWLQQRDGFSTFTRHQVLTNAWNANDTQTVYQIFSAYMSGAQPTVLQPGRQPGLAPQGAPQAPSNRLPMHQLAAPGPARPASSGAPGGPEPNQYTETQVAQFFRDLGRGVFNDTPARQQWAAGIERDIFAAQREGRVLPG